MREISFACVMDRSSFSSMIDWVFCFWTDLRSWLFAVDWFYVEIVECNRLKRWNKDERGFIDSENATIGSKSFDESSSDRKSSKLAKCQ